MFHTLSQASYLILTPSNAVVLLLLIGACLTRAPRTARLGGRMLWGGLAGLAALAILPIGAWLLQPLETRFPPFRPDGAPVAGIVVLGGTVSLRSLPDSSLRAQPSDAADRFFEAARLARLYPTSRVVVSGGPLFPNTRVSEADLVARNIERLGVDPRRIVRERLSRDTFENARFSRALAKPRPGERWLLVTSAAHMPRAVGCFRHAGFYVQAAPADWRGNYSKASGRWMASANLARVDAATKEYLGLLAYRLRGRTAELFPSA